MFKLKSILLSSFVGIFLILGLSAPTYAFDPYSGNCGTYDASGSAVCSSKNSDPILGKDGIIYKIAMLISYFAGAVAVIIIIYAGFVFVTSRADPQKITSARQTIMYSLIGIAVIVIAAQIVAIVISKFA